VPAQVHFLRGNPSKMSAADLAAAGAQGLQAAVEAPTCPTHLSADAKTEWRRIIGDLVQLGVVAKVDRAELAVYCTAYADWKKARQMINTLGESGFVEITPSGYKQMSAWMQIANRAEERMRAAGGAFGLSPASRAKLRVQSPQGELFGDDEKDKAQKYF
jgi:P27 family predicted phage terminase small subunit